MPCSNCSREFNTDEERVVGPRGRFYCRPCANEELMWCDTCDVVMLQGDHYNDPEGDCLCSNCFTEHWFNCGSCNNVTHYDNACTVSETPVCEQCYDRAFYCERCEESYFDPCTRHNNALELHSYDYTPDPRYLLGSAERTPKTAPMLFGIELELVMANMEHSRRVQTILNANSDWVYAKRDGSLPDTGFEVVTHPMSWQWMIENTLKVNTLLGRLAQYAAPDDSCGMHIHMSRDRHTPMHIDRMCSLIYDYPQFAVYFSGRDLDQMVEYARPTMSKDFRREMVLNYKFPIATHHYLLSISSAHPTVEMRMFSSTLSAATFWRNLQYCKALSEYTRDNKSTKLTDFRTWVNSKPDYYRLSESFQRLSAAFHDEPDPEGARLEV